MAKWSAKIHEEWIENLLKDRKDLKREQLTRTKELMDAAVPDALVEGYEHLIPSIVLPDANDRHVVATAIHSKCDAIVTFNLKDFPAENLDKYNLDAIHPDDFISYQFNLDLAKVIISVKKIRGRLENPPIDVDRYLDILHAQQLPKTVDLLSEYKSVL